MEGVTDEKNTRLNVEARARDVHTKIPSYRRSRIEAVREYAREQGKEVHLPIRVDYLAFDFDKRLGTSAADNDDSVIAGHCTGTSESCGRVM